ARKHDRGCRGCYAGENAADGTTHRSANTGSFCRLVSFHDLHLLVAVIAFAGLLGHHHADVVGAVAVLTERLVGAVCVLPVREECRDQIIIRVRCHNKYHRLNELISVYRARTTAPFTSNRWYLLATVKS